MTPSTFIFIFLCYSCCHRAAFSQEKLGFNLLYKGSAFAIVEPKQGQDLFSPVAILMVEQPGVSVETLPCKRKRKLLMEKATKAKMESDRN